MYSDIDFPDGPPLEKCSRTDLDDYWRWFQKMLAERPSILERHVRSTENFEKWSADLSPESLEKLEIWLSQKILASRDPRFPVRPTSPDSLKKFLEQGGLSDRSYSILFDCGFYLGEAIRKSVRDSKWFQVRTGGKRLIDFGHVVLGPFGMYNFNPVRLMTSKGFAHIDFPEKELSLLQYYENWSSKVLVEDQHKK